MDSSSETDQTSDLIAPAKSRRQLINGLSALATMSMASALSSCGSDESPLATPTPSGTPSPVASITPITDTDLFVLMQQLHYLQAEFYSRAIFGMPLAATLVTGAGTQGQVTGGATATIADTVLVDMLREIAAEKIDQVVRLRAVLGSSNPARPDINIAVDSTGVFTTAAQAARVVTAPALYNVYQNQDLFLLGAFLLEDPVLAAWRFVSTLMTSNANIDTAAGILATCAFHTGLIRSQLFARGAALSNQSGTSTSPLREASRKFSDLRDNLTPSTDDDRGVSTSSTYGADADVNPADGEGEIYGRLPQLTINIFYMTQTEASSGGFFPSGLNGLISKSVTV